MKSKIEKIIFIILIFISVFSIVIDRSATDLDELWNYNTARVISEGLIPYKYVSMITTPFYQLVTAFFLKIFPNEIITFRVLEAVLWTAILYAIFKIMNLITNEENISAISTCIVYLICKDIFCLDYNVFSLFLALIILYFELQNVKNNKTFEDNFKYNVLIGILAGLIICTKQSIGATSAIIVVLYNLIFVRNMEGFKKYIKISLQRILGILIPVGIMFIYLAINLAIKDFFDYAVFGISTFKNKIEYKKLFSNEKREIRVLSRLIPISILASTPILFVKNRKMKKESLSTEKEKNLNAENTLIAVKVFNNEKLIISTILIYTFSILLVMYPISDEVHFMIGSIIPIINILYMIFLVGNAIYNKIGFKKKKFLYKIISLIAFLMLFSVIIVKRINDLKNYSFERKCVDIEHYKYISMDKCYEDRIKEIQEFINVNQIKEIKTYILDSEAALYTIPANVYHKNFDMFLIGNLGKDGEEGQIEKIKNDDSKVVYLLKKDVYSLNWQTPMKVIEYVKRDMHKTGEIGLFDIYEK